MLHTQHAKQRAKSKKGKAYAEISLIDFKGFQGKCKGVYIKYMTEAFYAESLKSNKKTTQDY